MRKTFAKQLTELNTNLIEMGSMIEKAIRDATKATINQDVALADSVIEYDKEIDRKEKEIESICLRLLLQQQPVARDLRLISSALKMITDMERIGDQAADISELCIYLSKDAYIKNLEHISEMAKATIKMLSDSIDAFVKKDLELAKQVILYDNVVDGLFLIIKDELFKLIQANIDNGKQALDLLMIAKYYERIGDHAENIAEWVVFSITGEHH